MFLYFFLFCLKFLLDLGTQIGESCGCQDTPAEPRWCIDGNRSHYRFLLLLLPVLRSWCVRGEAQWERKMEEEGTGSISASFFLFFCRTIIVFSLSFCLCVCR